MPFLSDHAEFLPGLFYDTEAKINMAQVPPNDVVFLGGAVGFPVLNRPFVYDQTNGHIYFCNGNYSVAGDFYYDW